MDVYDAVRTMLAVRQYKDKPLPRDLVRRIVEAGRLTGSASNKQPWHFIVVEDKDTLRRISEIATTGPYIAQAPCAIVVAVENTPLAISDGSRAIQDMMLTAWEGGAGTNWVGFMGYDEIKPLLGIPNEMKILAIIPFGYPAEHRGGAKKNRKPLTEVASLGRFGTPFE